MRPTTGSNLLLAVLLSLAAPAALAAQQSAQADPPPNAEFVYIDSQELLEKAPGASEAQQTFQQEMSQYRSEVDQLRSELDSLRQAYQQQEGMLSPSARETRQQEIVEKQRQLQQRLQELERQATQRRQELLAPILDEVRSVIREIRDENGYTMVFDASASGLLAADPRLDITGLVIQRLQERQTSQGGGGGGSGQEGGSGDA